ncbi:carbamoyltransferase family protein [Candidatus Thiomargarita nelsonii]|uniref:Carbamoyltransferase family protein n=1 Tax=Candidatus Thiomargarita nelsonii TaxID=1003181 RepID=A0A176S4G5_9GAMM|nr:carbamoyltransferase family protein [Candidatus Thiomargarita nelsonii]
MNILGISAYYHDSAAALIRDGDIIAAAQEERFSRKKHDARFPVHAIRSCLEIGQISMQDIDHIVFYDKPLVKFERLLETYLGFAPKGFRSFVQAMPIWLKEKLYLKKVLRKELTALGTNQLPPLLFTEHHQAHAASAFFPSPFKKAGVLCLDGVGEWATTTVWLGEDNQLTPQWEIDFPHSLGLLYSAFTYFTGFKVNSGEYKLMGLAPYGEPKYVQTILDNLIDLKEDGTFQLNMRYFNYAVGLTMTNSQFDKLFGGPPRPAEGTLTQREMDLARSIQAVTEEVVLRLARTVHKELANVYELDNSTFYNNQRPRPYLNLKNNQSEINDPGFWLFDWSHGFRFVFHRLLRLDWKYELGLLDLLNSTIALDSKAREKYEKQGLEVLDRVLNNAMASFPNTRFYGFLPSGKLKNGFDKEYEKIFVKHGAVYFSEFYNYVDSTEGTNCLPLDGHWNHLGNKVAGNMLSKLLADYEK